MKQYNGEKYIVSFTSFGQRFEVTPIQMITMVSTIANGGTYITPRVVKQIIDSETGEVTNVEVEKKDRVITSIFN